LLILFFQFKQNYNSNKRKTMQKLQHVQQKANLRKIMKDVIISLNPQEKALQSKSVTNYILNYHAVFRQSQHIAVYLPMKQEEIDTMPIIEAILGIKSHQNAINKKVYVPHVEADTSQPTQKQHEISGFYELKSIDQYKNEMNTNNRYKFKQFNSVKNLTKIDPSVFDFVIAPGLLFGLDPAPKNNRLITRLGRGKGFYDYFLTKINPTCFTIGVGFNEQFFPFNKKLLAQNLNVPVNEEVDVKLNEFLCQKNCLI
jgi:5-formyltetrahydrofolate cyclo-ligase